MILNIDTQQENMDKSMSISAKLEVPATFFGPMQPGYVYGNIATKYSLPPMATE